MRSHSPDQINWTTAARPHIRGVITSGMEDGDAQSPNNPWYIRDHDPAEQSYRANLNSLDLKGHQRQLKL